MTVPNMISPIGANANLTHTEAQFSVGDRATGKDGSIWQYVQANGAIAAGDVVLLDEDWQADQLDLTNSASAFGQSVGVAAAAFADNEYGWVQVFGVCDAINCGSSCAANATVNSTSTAGRVDDDATAGSEDIDGLILTTAESSGNTAPGLLNYPKVGATNS